jgi:hypothetical protein
MRSWTRLKQTNALARDNTLQDLIEKDLEGGENSSASNRFQHTLMSNAIYLWSRPYASIPTPFILVSHRQQRESFCETLIRDSICLSTNV